MPVEYRLTYSKIYNPDHPRAAGGTVRLSLEGIMREYQKTLDWKKRVPACDIQDIRIFKRTYTEEEITPEPDEQPR
jgi:hypothetical protein